MRRIMRYKILATVILITLFISLPALAIADIEIWNCSGKIVHKSNGPIWDKIIKELKIIIFDDRKHHIVLIPLSDQTAVVETEFGKVEVPKILLEEFKIQNNSAPVWTGEIELIEKLESAKLVNQYKMIVIDKQPKIIVGLVLENGRLYSLRMDKQKDNWKFTFYDTTKLETVEGICK